MRDYIKKPPRYLEKDMLGALKMVKEEKKGVAESGRAFGIPRTTLQSALRRLAKEEASLIGPSPLTIEALPKDMRSVSVN
jgi:hypothetical protein